MSIKIANKLENERRSRDIKKSFNDFRRQLNSYAKTNFADQIQDFSEASVGGMLLDFAAIVGDSLAFYVDQQFDELNYETSKNTKNISSHLKRAGVKGGNASPSSAYVTFIIEVDIDSTKNINLLEPDARQLPIVHKGSVLESADIKFILSEDVDFRQNPEKYVSESDDNGLPIKLFLEKKGVCTSGTISEESITFSVDDIDVFLSYTLSNNNVHKIVKITDDFGNEYYEVDFLSQDTVYLNVENSKYTQLYPTAAPFRFISEKNYQNNTTTLRFGNGSGKKLNDNMLTNPEDFLLPLKHRDYNSNVMLDPNMLIKSNSLGVSPAGSTLTITYIHGGGKNHNVDAESIDTIKSAIVTFPNISDDDVDIAVITDDITDTLDVINEKPAVGGSNSLTLNDLKSHIPNMINSQSRIVNEKDLFSRIYTMPTDYGRVNKIAVLENEYTNLSKDLFVVCLDNDNKYIHANDALKVNLKNYINQFRLLGDSFNILDSPIYNFGIDLTIGIKINYSVEEVLDRTLSNIDQNLNFKALQINEAINVNDIINVVLNTDGVANIITLPKNMIFCKNSEDDFVDEADDETFTYSRNPFSPLTQFENGFIFPIRGGIFELKYPELDITVRNG